MPHRVSHPHDMPVCAGLAEWLLWLGDQAAEWASPGARSITGVDSSTACRPGRRRGESAYRGRKYFVMQLL
jgi:hypothetical protein